jgi:small subunit ribosomal protein S7
MPRKFRSTEYLLRPDPRFDNKLLSKFINCVMQDGKKSTAQKVVYDALDIVGKRIPDEPALDVFVRAIENLKPHVEVRSKRVGGATYQVPMEVRPKRKQALALRWMLEVCRKKKGRPLAQRMAEELIACYRREGAAYTIRENVHKMAEANKAFAHFAW